MSSLVLPTTSTLPTLRAEGDVVRAAARGDRAAFDELFRRHGRSAWRLGRALTPDAEAAAAAVAGGFVRALRGARRRGPAAAEARNHVLAGVYRTALDQARDDRPARIGAGGDALEASFRGLPERWRAALWLQEVEGLDPARAAAVLGISPAMAKQLASRGRRGLADRLSHAGGELPADLSSSLATVAATMPAALAATVAEAWHRGVVTDPAARLGPLTDLLGDRAERTLGAAVAGLLALSVVGLGVLGGTAATTANPPVAAGASAGGHGLGVTPPARITAPGKGTLFGYSYTGPAGSAGDGGFTLTGALRAPTPTSTSAPTPASGSHPATVVTTPASPPATTTPLASSQPTPSAPSHPASPPTTTPATKTVVSVPSVLTVGTGGGATTVTVLPSPSSASSGAVSATVCPDGLSLKALGITALNQCPATTAAKKDTTKSKKGTKKAAKQTTTTSGSGSSSNVVNQLLTQLGL